MIYLENSDFGNIFTLTQTLKTGAQKKRIIIWFWFLKTPLTAIFNLINVHIYFCLKVLWTLSLHLSMETCVLNCKSFEL